MTETFPFTLTFTNGFFEVSQPTNANYVVSAPAGDDIFLTHPSIANYYYFGNAGYAITLDYTLCTNLTTASRKAQIDAALALAVASPISGNVNVLNFPATQPVSGTVSVTQPVSVTQGTTPWVTSSSPTIPIPADLVGASRTTTGTLVTIPTGRTFMGSLSLSCSITVAGNSQPNIASSGAGVLPLGTLHQIVAAGLALSTATNSNTIDNLYIYGGSAGATVTFTQGASGTSTGQIAGRLL